MIPKRWILICGMALLAATTAGWGQKASVWRVFKTADGLPQSYFSTVSVSSRGNVWVKHLNAPLISSLNGYDIKTFPSPGIGAYRFYESPGGQLWTIATNGLQQLVDGSWVQYPVPEIAAEFRRGNLSLFRPVSLWPVRQSRVLFLTQDALREFNAEIPNQSQTTTLLKAAETHLQKLTGMVTARDGNLWLTAAHGVAHVSGPLRNLKAPLEWREFPLTATQQFQNLREPVSDDAEGITMLADSLNGKGPLLVYFDGVQWSILAALPKNTTHAWRTADGTYWATIANSLLQKKAGEQRWTTDEDIATQRIYDCASETNGIFWLATADGLYRHAPLTWHSLQGMGSAIYGLTGDQAGGICVAAADALHLFRDRQWKAYPYPDGMEPQATSALFNLPQGSVILGAGERLFQFDPSTGQFKNITHNGEARLKALGLMKDGRLAVQALSASGSNPRYRLELYDGANFSAFPVESPNLELGNDLTCLFAAQSGNLWLCGSKGLAWYHDRKWQLSNLRAESLPENAACMAEMNDGRIWCGIEDKVWEFDGKTWRSIQHGFDRINALLKARDESVWIASDNGLHRYNLGAWAANNIEEGLPANAIHTVWQDGEGHIWAGTARGLCQYEPQADQDPPRSYVRDLPDGRTTLPEDAIVNVSFGAEDKWKFTPRDRLLFSYRLDQKEWSPYQEEKSAVFSSVPPGKHYFQVRGMDRNWNVDPKPAELDFIIVPPWYMESRLVWIGSAGLALALFFAAVAVNRHRRLVRSYAEVEAKVALRTRQLERANEELFHSQKMTALGTLAAGIAHDFNNILSIIKGSAQIIEDNLSNPQKVATRTSRIKTVVEQGAGIVNAMLGFSRGPDKPPVPEDLNVLVQETIKLLGDRFRRDIAVEFHPTPRLPKVVVSRDYIQQILLNLIFNAAEAMTGQRHIILATALANKLPNNLALAPAPAAQYLHISVKDSGCGIAPEIMPRIFEPFFTTKAFSARRGTGLGLSMVYELAKQMQAGLSVESIVGSGSTFTLIIPVVDLPMDASAENK